LPLASGFCGASWTDFGPTLLPPLPPELEGERASVAA